MRLSDERLRRIREGNADLIRAELVRLRNDLERHVADVTDLRAWIAELEARLEELEGTHAAHD